MALLDSSPRSSDGTFTPEPQAKVPPDVASPAITAARLWDRFRGAFWTLLDQGTISLGTFLVNVQLARQLDASEYGTFALLFGSYFLLQLINAALIFFPLMLKLADSKEERSSGLVFVSLILTTLTTCSFTAVVVSCLIFFYRSELAFAAAAYIILWQLQDVLRRALLAQFCHRVAAIADGITYIGAAAGIGILASLDSLSLSNALFAMASTCTLAIAVQALYRPPTFPRGINARILLRDFWRNGKWALVNGVMLIVTLQAFPWVLATSDGGPAAAGAFQAILNIANLANPIAFGLYNIILPAVARAYASGDMHHAWRAARTYIAIGAALLSIFLIPVMLVPHTVLALLYGANSSYAYLEQAVRVMALAAAINALAEMMDTFIHGVGSGKLAVWMNGAGLGVVALLLPLLGLHSVLEFALVFAAARVVRFIAASCIITRMLSSEKRSLRAHVKDATGRRGA